MEKIHLQISKARRLLIARLALMYLTWMICIGMIVAVVGLAIPKLWAFSWLQTPASANQWNLWWIGGCLAGAVISAGVAIYLRRSSDLDAAIEIDSRFDLRERISSAISLPDEELSSRAGKALLADASKSADRIDVRDQFSVGFNWRNLIPVGPAILLFVLIFFVDNAVSEPPEEQPVAEIDQRKRIEAANDALRDKIQQELDKAEAMGLEDAETALREVDSILNEDERDAGSRERALVRMNDARRAIEEKVNKIGDAESMRRQLAQMNESKTGPADSVSEALQDGDLERAADELDDLAEQLQNGDLTPEEQQDLAEQLDDLQNQMEQMAQQHEENKDVLREQIQQAKADGDLDKAAEMQDALEQMEQMQPQMNQMNELAGNLGQASDALNEASQSEGADAAQQLAQANQALEEASDQLEVIESDIEQIESLESILDQIAESKNMLNQSDAEIDPSGDQQVAQDAQPGNQTGEDGTPQLAQGGDQQQNQNGQPSQGSGNQNGGDQTNSTPGSGQGEGNGRGARGENENQTEFQNERVNSDPNQGPVVVTGDADGENATGPTRDSVVQQVRSSLESRTEVFDEATLPRNQQDHAREYFQKYSNQKK